MHMRCRVKDVRDMRAYTLATLSVKERRQVY